MSATADISPVAAKALCSVTDASSLSFLEMPCLDDDELSSSPSNKGGSPEFISLLIGRSLCLNGDVEIFARSKAAFNIDDEFSRDEELEEVEFDDEVHTENNESKIDLFNIST